MVYRLTAAEKRYSTAWLRNQRATFVAGIVVYGLFAAAMWRYLTKLEPCECAQARAKFLRRLLLVAIGLFCVKAVCIALDWAVYIPGYVASDFLLGGAMLLGVAVDIAIAALVLKFYATDCPCSESWEKHVWAGASVLVLLSVLTTFLTGRMRYAIYWMPMPAGRVVPIGPGPL